MINKNNINDLEHTHTCTRTHTELAADFLDKHNFKKPPTT